MLDFQVLVYFLIFRIKMKMRKTDIFWSFIETENILFKIKCCQFTRVSEY